MEDLDLPAKRVPGDRRSSPPSSNASRDRRPDSRRPCRSARSFPDLPACRRTRSCRAAPALDLNTPQPVLPSPENDRPGSPPHSPDHCRGSGRPPWCSPNPGRPSAGSRQSRQPCLQHLAQAMIQTGVWKRAPRQLCLKPFTALRRIVRCSATRPSPQIVHRQSALIYSFIINPKSQALLITATILWVIVSHPKGYPVDAFET